MYSTRQKPIFDDRHDAGKQLAEKLVEYTGKSVVVLAIPNGGVPVALEVATAIQADLELIICRKIPMPLTPEAGFGALTDDGTLVLNENMVKRIDLTQEQIEHEVNKVRAEIKKRSLLYKLDRLPVRLTDRTVIIIDDGLASGFTMLAAIESTRRRHPKEVIVAVPCASEIAIGNVEKAADKVITCAIGTQPRFAVADFYRRWYDLSDNEVVKYLMQWKSRHLRFDQPSRR